MQDAMTGEERGSRWPRRAGWLVLAALLLVYYFAPVFAVARLGNGVAHRDSVLVSEAVDYPRLRKSVARQIVAELARTATGVQKGFAQQVAGGPVSAWLDDFLTPETVTALLAGDPPRALGPEAANLPGLPPFSADSLQKVVDLWWRSGFVTLGEYRVPVEAAGKAATVLDFSLVGLSAKHGLDWRLTGITLPQPVIDVAVKRWHQAESASR